MVALAVTEAESGLSCAYCGESLNELELILVDLAQVVLVLRGLQLAHELELELHELVQVVDDLGEARPESGRYPGCPGGSCCF